MEVSPSERDSRGLPLLGRLRQRPASTLKACAQPAGSAGLLPPPARGALRRGRRHSLFRSSSWWTRTCPRHPHAWRAHLRSRERLRPRCLAGPCGFQVEEPQCPASSHDVVNSFLDDAAEAGNFGGSEPCRRPHASCAAGSPIAGDHWGRSGLASGTPATWCQASQAHGAFTMGGAGGAGVAVATRCGMGIHVGEPSREGPAGWPSACEHGNGRGPVRAGGGHAVDG